MIRRQGKSPAFMDTFSAPGSDKGSAFLSSTTLTGREIPNFFDHCNFFVNEFLHQKLACVSSQTAPAAGFCPLRINVKYWIHSSRSFREACLKFVHISSHVNVKYGLKTKDYIGKLRLKAPTPIDMIYSLSILLDWTLWIVGLSIARHFRPENCFRQTNKHNCRKLAT